MKFIKAIAFLSLLFISISFILTGCVSQKCMTLLIQRPAEVNLRNYNSIAVGSIVDPSGCISEHALDFSDNIAMELFNNSKFEVVDRQMIAAVHEERNVMAWKHKTYKGLPEEKVYAPTLATAVIMGRIQVDSYDEYIDESEPFDEKRKVPGRKDTTYIVKVFNKTRHGRYNITVNFKLIDGESSKIIAIKNFFADATGTESIKLDFPREKRVMPPEIFVQDLYKNCFNRIVKDFIKYISPYFEKVRVCFQDDELLSDKLKLAVNNFELENWNGGMKLLFDCLTEPGLDNKVLAKAHYNLGLIQMYTKIYDEAEVHFFEARKLDPDYSVYANIFTVLKREIDSDNKLKMQIQE